MRRVLIIVPCFNEERRLPAAAFVEYAHAQSDVGFLFVDDGSRDGTRALLESVCQRAPDACELLALERNGGKAEAVRRGVRHAASRGPAYFGYWDADLSTALDEIAPFAAILDARPELMLVIGSRVKLLGRIIERRALRHYLGRLFATCASVVLRLPIYDTQCGAKLFRNTRGTRFAFGARFLSRWLFDVELLARLGLLGGRRAAYDTHRCVYERPLGAWRDVAGSKIRLRDWAKAVYELMRIGCRYRLGAR
ncbi:MAG: glycosyltransferase [Planctomycetota bacterium]|nr:glycosyltransferase [Planctomycetota bacterium]